MTFANNLDPDEAPQNVGLHLRSKLFDTQQKKWVETMIFFFNILKETNIWKNYPACKELKITGDYSQIYIFSLSSKDKIYSQNKMRTPNNSMLLKSKSSLTMLPWLNRNDQTVFVKNNCLKILTLSPQKTTVVPYANSLDLVETPSYSASHPDPSCLTLRQHFHQLWATLKHFEKNWD